MGPLAIPYTATYILNKIATLRGMPGHELVVEIFDCCAGGLIREANPEWWPTVEA